MINIRKLYISVPKYFKSPLNRRLKKYTYVNRYNKVKKKIHNSVEQGIFPNVNIELDNFIKHMKKLDS